jgi:hypothetical protein
MRMKPSVLNCSRRVRGLGGSGGVARGPYLGSGNKHQRMNGYPVTMKTIRKIRDIGKLHSRDYSIICNKLEGGGLG